MKKSLSGDRIFFFIVITLIIVGMATFSSAALGLLARPDGEIGRLAFTQLTLGLIPGLILLFLIRYSPQALIAQAGPYLYAITVIMTALVFVPGLGVTANGATRWIDLGFITLQPSEFLKIGIVLMLAFYLSKMQKKLHEFQTGLIPFLMIVGIPSLLLLLQPNTSTVLVVGITATVMYLLAGAPWRDVFIIALLALLTLAILVFTRPYLMERVSTYFDPSRDPLASGYQIQQSLIAIGSGGIAGRGFGQSAQKFNYLPEPVGDSVFAVFGEEFGFIGASFIILLFTAFAVRGFHISASASSMFGALAAAGLTLVISISAFLHIGAMLAVLPLTGLPLPFISHGGTALLAALISVGIILNVAAHKRAKA